MPLPEELGQNSKNRRHHEYFNQLEQDVAKHPVRLKKDFEIPNYKISRACCLQPVTAVQAIFIL